MSRATAIADLLAATSPDILGQSVLINGTPVSAVKKILPQDEAAHWAAEGVRVEAVRVVVSLSALGFTPRERSRIDVDGLDYRVESALVTGDMLKFVGTRFVG